MQYMVVIAEIVIIGARIPALVQDSEHVETVRNKRQSGHSGSAAGAATSVAWMEGQRALQALDGEQRNALAAQGATLLLLDVPLGTTISIDFTSYAAGERFQGLKMIPPGLHFLSYCAMAKSDRAEAPIKAGFWFEAKLGGVLVRRWDAAAEEFAPESAVDADELERFTAAVREHQFDSSTGPYPYDSHGDWRTLTEHLTIHALKRHQPDPGMAVAGTELEGFDPRDEVLKADPRLMEAALARATDHTPPVTFSAVAARPRPRPGASNPLDRSHELAELHSTLPESVPGAAASARVGPRAAAVLAELELAFVLFMLISSWAAFEQWKKMVILLCSCDDDVSNPSREPLFLAFLRLFRAQLAYTPRELFTDELAKDNFLQLALAGFFETAADAQQAPRAIVKETQAFDAFLQRRFNWSAVAPEILEDSEWGPTVVSGAHNATGDVPVGQNANSKTVEKVGGDADHEARVAAAFGGLELGGTEQLATAARQSRLRRMEGLESEQTEQTEGGPSEETIVASLDERRAGGAILSTTTAGSVSSPRVGFQDAYLQMGGHVDDITTSTSPSSSLPPPEELNTSWESPTAAEFRIRRESIAKAEAERVAANEAAVKAAAESDVETDLGTETEAGTESEIDTDTDTDDLGNTDRRRARRAEHHQRMDVVDEDSLQDDTGEHEEEESEEVLAASAAEDALYRAADEATRANPAPPPGQWAVDSLDQEGDASNGYRERQLQASALRDALAAAKAAKVAQGAA